MEQLQTVEPPLLREAVSHAEIEVPIITVGKNKQGDALVGSVAEELPLGSDIQSAASFGFDKNLRATVTQQREVHAALACSILGLDRPGMGRVPVQRVQDRQNDRQLDLFLVSQVVGAEATNRGLQVRVETHASGALAHRRDFKSGENTGARAYHVPLFR